LSKTSIKDWTIGVIVVGAIMSTLIFSYIQADVNYDTTGIDSSVLVAFGNYTAILAQANATGSDAYDEVEVNKNLFDVIGGLIGDAITAVRTFIDGLTFFSDSTKAMLSWLAVPFTIIAGIGAIITITLAAYFLFKIVAGKDDEKP
jgi:hypothetical protein